MQSPPTVRAAAAVQAAEAAVVCAASALAAADARPAVLRTGSGIALTLIGFGTAAVSGWWRRARRAGDGADPCAASPSSSRDRRHLPAAGHRYGWGVRYSRSRLPVRHAARAPSLRALTSGRPVPPQGGGRWPGRLVFRPASLVLGVRPLAQFASGSWPAAGTRASARCELVAICDWSCCRRSAAAGSASPWAAAAPAGA